MPAAARFSDFHQCPMSTQVGPVAVPHVGGPIMGPGAATVMIAGLPAAIVGDTALCIGPPDSLVAGSKTVKIMGMPAVRQGDKTAHGGTVMLGCFTVMIGG
jgi:uncharacterized Zn-binding protein involved in type VI secretion